jgi:hypothetical protein
VRAFPTGGRDIDLADPHPEPLYRVTHAGVNIGSLGSLGTGSQAPIGPGECDLYSRIAEKGSSRKLSIETTRNGAGTERKRIFIRGCIKVPAPGVLDRGYRPFCPGLNA